MNIVIKDNRPKNIVADLSLNPSKEKAGLVIFCHGYKGFKDWGQFKLLPDYFVRAGFHFLKFNFSYNGGTESQVIDFPDLESFSENNYSREVDDIKRVIDWVCNPDNPHSSAIDTGSICLMGHSRGGAMSIIAASRDDRIKKLITWAAVGDLEKRFPRGNQLSAWEKSGIAYVDNARTNQKMPLKYQFYEDFIENKEALNVHEAEKKLKIPHLLLHGTQDETVFLGEALQLMSLNEHTSLIKIHGGTHTFGGHQPYDLKELPQHTEMALNYSIAFLQNE